MNSHASRWVLVLLAGAVTAATSSRVWAQDGIPTRPEQLQFKPLAYEPPHAADYRVKLNNGMAAYLVPDHSLPLVSVTVLMRVGPDLDPPGKEGVAATAMYLLTRSGTATRTAQQVEDRVAFLGAQLASNLGGRGGNPFAIQVGPSESAASINLLSKDLDEGLGLLVECLEKPAWEADRLKLRKEQALQSMKERNDASDGIEEREWGFLVRGDGHWSNRYSTAASMESITKEDLAAFHDHWIGPKNFVLAVSGDFDRAQMVKRLDQAFGKWPAAAEHAGAPPAPTAATQPGWFLVDKDVNQGRVSIGLRALDRYDPDYQAARVMNDILGAGGFSSRLVNRIRSDEGLAYSVRSAFDGGTYYPDAWRVQFQSKVRSVAYAIQIALAEVTKIRDAPVTSDEIELTRGKMIDSFPTQFDTPANIAFTLANEEITGRYAKDPKYFEQYRERVRAVTVADVQRVAKRLLDPSKLTVLMVGNAKDMLLGDGKHDAQLAVLAGGEPKHLPLRDPLTMKPMANP